VPKESNLISSRQTSRGIWAGVLALLLVVGMYMILAATVKVELGDSSIRVKGIYGTEIRYADVVSVESIDSFPAGGIRTNGIGLGFMNVGYFSFPRMGGVLLYQVRREGPYIFVKTKAAGVVFGFGAEENGRIRRAIEAKTGK
jgi:hypothetical protein